ncbi:hypothetical protein ACQ4PT_062541 [Festuca glaucescens]
MENLAAASMVAKPTVDSISRAIPIDAEPMAEMTPSTASPMSFQMILGPHMASARARQCSGESDFTAVLEKGSPLDDAALQALLADLQLQQAPARQQYGGVHGAAAAWAAKQQQLPMNESKEQTRMADAVGSVAKIVQVALKIKEAATTARQNKKDCHHIKSRVDVLNKTLSHHENNEDLMEDPAVMAALEALHGILAEAPEVVTECQEKRNIVCLHCTAGNFSRQLGKVEQRISYLSSDAMLTIMSYQLLRKFQEAAPHPPPQIYSPGTQSPLQPPGRVRKKSKQNQDEASEKEQTRTRISQTPVFGEWDAANSDQTESYTIIFERIRAESNHESGTAVCSAAMMPDEPRSLVHRIAEVAGNIKEAAGMVLKNNDECLEIGELVNKVSTLLSQLEGKKMVDEPPMRGALEKLLVTFHRAHTLVIACQRRGFGIVWLSTLPGRLSTQLHEVMDQIASNIADMTAIVLV